MAHVQRKQPEKRASTEILIGGTAHENKRIKTRMVLPERRYLPGKPESIYRIGAGRHAAGTGPADKNNRALAAPSMVEFEQIKTIDKSRIKGYLGKLTKEQLSEIDDYLKISLGMYIPETVEAP